MEDTTACMYLTITEIKYINLAKKSVQKGRIQKGNTDNTGPAV